MKKWINVLKKLPIWRILATFLAGIFLIVTTACSGANAQGARPENPPVQAGGANNPYKMGGDNFTNYHMSTDPKVTNESTQKKSDQSSLQINSQILLAVNKEAEQLYPGAETPMGRAKKEAELPLITEEEFQHPEPGGLIQREPDVGTRIQKRLETVKEAVEEASKFLPEKLDEAKARPELQPNPAVNR